MPSYPEGCGCSPCEDCRRVCSAECHGCGLSSEDLDRIEEEQAAAEANAAAMASVFVAEHAARDTAPLSPVARSFSFEQEVTSGFRFLSEVWYGLAHTGEIPFQLDAHPDSTCDGELVFSRVQANDPHHSGVFRAVLELHEEYRRKGSPPVQVGRDCGGHVHVGTRSLQGEQLGQDGMVALYNSFSYLEDLLYRLASAGWRDHRTAGDNYDNWASCLRKLDRAEKGNRLAVARAAGQERYQGLNLTPFLGSITNCQCRDVAVAGDWSLCRCGAPDYMQNTVEFRLWNSTLRPYRAEAYAVLSLAMVEHAARSEKKRDTLAALPVNSWTGSIHNVPPRDSLKRQANYLYETVLTTDRERSAVARLQADCSCQASTMIPAGVV